MFLPQYHIALRVCDAGIDVILKHIYKTGMQDKSEPLEEG